MFEHVLVSYKNTKKAQPQISKDLKMHQNLRFFENEKSKSLANTFKVMSARNNLPKVQVARVEIRLYFDVLETLSLNTFLLRLLNNDCKERNPETNR